MMSHLPLAVSIASLFFVLSSSTSVIAQQADTASKQSDEHAGPPAGAMGDFKLSSSEFTDGGELPDDLKCTRHGGDGESPPLEWSGAPEDTGSFVTVMQHYAVGRYPGVDSPSHYWLLWDIPASATGIERGNPEGLGYEGSDKDMRSTGYTPPCSPEGTGTHTYTITVYAVDNSLDALPENDDPTIVWDDVMAALNSHVLNAASISFTD